MNLDELAQIMGKARTQVEEMLQKNDVIELNLTERSDRKKRKEGKNIVIIDR